MGYLLMKTEWLYRINIICPKDDKVALSALWTVLAPEGDAEKYTFGIGLSADGMEPITHYGASTAATEEMRKLIQSIFTDELNNCSVDILPHYVNNWEEFLKENGLTH